MKTISVIQAKHLYDYTIEVYFSDGTRQVIDFKPQIDKIRIPEYKKYQNVEHFKGFAIDSGNLVWGEDWDLIFPVGQLYKGKVKH